MFAVLAVNAVTFAFLGGLVTGVVGARASIADALRSDRPVRRPARWLFA